MPPIPKVILKRDKEKPLRGRHPWIFSGAIEEVEGPFKTGDLVSVHSHQGEFLGKGYLNPRSQIAVRILTFEDEEVNRGFFIRRIEEALFLRKPWLGPDTNAFRLVHSEGDFLPGLIVDRYADYLVVQFLTAGIESFKDTIVEALRSVVKSSGIYEKDDSEVRAFEGLPERLALLSGEAPPDFVTIQENGLSFLVDVHGGQKTGFFLDQRENRKRVERFSRDKRILNCFAYTGAFSIYAARGGAREIISVEASESAINTAKHHVELNGLDPERFQFHREDVFDFLRTDQEPYDLIILDPPAFAPSKNAVMQASRGYKDINRLAFKLLVPGGLLFTYSCSHHIDPLLFQKIIFAAAKDANVRVRILEKTSHPFDHPINIYHPEGEYLKGFILAKS